VACRRGTGRGHRIGGVGRRRARQCCPERLCGLAVGQILSRDRALFGDRAARHSARDRPRQPRDRERHPGLTVALGKSNTAIATSGAGAVALALGQGGNAVAGGGTNVLAVVLGNQGQALATGGNKNVAIVFGNDGHAETGGGNNNVAGVFDHHSTAFAVSGNSNIATVLGCWATTATRAQRMATATSSASSTVTASQSPAARAVTTT
jgi:hypothetical protein